MLCRLSDGERKRKGVNVDCIYRTPVIVVVVVVGQALTYTMLFLPLLLFNLQRYRAVSPVGIWARMNGCFRWHTSDSSCRDLLKRFFFLFLKQINIRLCIDRIKEERRLLS